MIRSVHIILIVSSFFKIPKTIPRRAGIPDLVAFRAAMLTDGVVGVRG